MESRILCNYQEPTTRFETVDERRRRDYEGGWDLSWWWWLFGTSAGRRRERRRG